MAGKRKPRSTRAAGRPRPGARAAAKTRQLEAAVARHRAGRFEEAAALYRRLLEREPANPDALHLLGVVSAQLGDAAEAVRAISRAIELRPETPDFHYNLALAHRDQGDRGKARERLERALALDPEHAGAHQALARLLEAMGEADRALEHLSKAATLEPGNAALHDSLGLALFRRGRFEAAIAAYRTALDLEPENPEVLSNLGVAHHASGELEAALECYRMALAISPRHAAAHDNLGSALRELGRFDEAVAQHREAVALKPDLAHGYANLAAALAQTEATEEAFANYRRALDLDPEAALSHSNLGNLYRHQNRLDEAIAAQRRALAIDPECAEAHWGLANALLLAGDFEPGWAEFEWRLRLKELAGKWPKLPGRPWDGAAPGPARLLLSAEQGVGDTLQLVRYAPLIEARGGVILRCQRSLVRLMEGVPGIARVVAQGEPLPEVELHASLMSLPRLFRTTLETIPARVPYLAAPGTGAERFEAALGGAQGRRRVGIVWAGNPAHKNDHRRSCPLGHFLRLAELPGVALFSLQKEAPAGAPLDDPRVTDLAPLLDDFAATAQAIERLDLVLSVDTAVAHLGGALGRPVWVVLPFAPDWRWLLARDDSPWYPSLRLFRQRRPGDWEGVFAEVAAALRQLPPTRRTPHATRPRERV